MRTASPWTPATAAALLTLLTALAYSNAVTPTFQFDDHAILKNPALADPATFLDPVAAYQAGTDALSRFVAYASFGIDRTIWGLDARGFHLTNVLVHLVAVLLVYLLVLELYRTPRLSESRLARSAPAVALLAAALFAVHPLQTQAVTYVVQRVTSLAVALGLAGLVAWLRFRRGAGPARFAWLAAATVATAAAMLTKEIAFTFPALAVAAELAFFRGPARARLLGLVPLVATMTIVPTIVLLGPPVAERIQGGGEAGLALSGLGRREYLLTQAHVVLAYLRLLVWPTGQNLFPDPPIARALDPWTVLAVALHAAALVAAVVIGWRERERAPHRTLVAFGVIWFYAALSVESLAVVIIDVMNEHRVYYPSVGAFVAISTVVVAAVERTAAGGWQRKAAAVAAAAVVVALGAATFARNRVWADEVVMWKDVAAKSPELASAHRMLGGVLLRLRRGPEAVAPLKRAVELKPYYAEAWLDLSRAYATAGDAARSAHARATYRYISMDVAGALATWDDAVRIAPGDGVLHHGRGLALRALGRQTQATEELAVACKLGVARACSGGGMVPDP